MNIKSNTRILGVCTVLGAAMVSTTAVEAQIEVAVYDFDSVDMSGLGANGGVITATYKLEDGHTDPGLGNTFDLDFTFSAWSDSNFTFNGGDTATYSGGPYNVDYLDAANPTFPVGTATTTFTIEDAPTTGLDLGWIPLYDHVGLAGSNSTTGNDGQIQFTWDVPLDNHGTVRTLTYEGTDLGSDGSTNFSSKADRRVNLFSPAQEIAFQRSVPEPSSVMLTGMSVLLLSLRRKR